MWSSPVAAHAMRTAPGGMYFVSTTSYVHACSIHDRCHTLRYGGNGFTTAHVSSRKGKCFGSRFRVEHVRTCSTVIHEDQSFVNREARFLCSLVSTFLASMVSGRRVHCMLLQQRENFPAASPILLQGQCMGLTTLVEYRRLNIVMSRVLAQARSVLMGTICYASSHRQSRNSDGTVAQLLVRRVFESISGCDVHITRFRPRD